MIPDPMQLLEETEKFVELMTGIKAKWVAAGWTVSGAELMTVEMLKSSRGQQ